MKKVLLVSGGDIERAGVQIFLSQWIKMAPPDEFEFVWYCLGEVTDRSFAELIEKDGIRILAGKHRKESSSARYCHLYRDLCNILKKEKFDIIHVNTGGIVVLTIAIHAAVIYKIPIRIAHSHSCISPEGIIVKLACRAMQVYLRRKATYCAACSTDAGIDVFGDKVLSSPKWRLVQNTIDTRKFAFNEQVRSKFRKKISAGSCILMGCVGVLDKHKNQMLALDVVKWLKQNNINNIKLLLLGAGPMENELKDAASSLRIAKDVYFVGSSSCVENWLQAMDIFLMPSVAEGLGIAALEAQAAGLPCILSDRMPREVQVSDHVEFVPIESVESWGIAVHEFMRIHPDRKRESDRILDTKIDVAHTTKYIESLYH